MKSNKFRKIFSGIFILIYLLTAPGMLATPARADGKPIVIQEDGTVTYDGGSASTYSTGNYYAITKAGEFGDTVSSITTTGSPSNAGTSITYTGVRGIDNGESTLTITSMPGGIDIQNNGWIGAINQQSSSNTSGSSHLSVTGIGDIKVKATGSYGAKGIGVYGAKNTDITQNTINIGAKSLTVGAQGDAYAIQGTLAGRTTTVNITEAVTVESDGKSYGTNLTAATPKGEAILNFGSLNVSSNNSSAYDIHNAGGSALNINLDGNMTATALNGSAIGYRLAGNAAATVKGKDNKAIDVIITGKNGIGAQIGGSGSTAQLNQTANNFTVMGTNGDATGFYLQNSGTGMTGNISNLSVTGTGDADAIYNVGGTVSGNFGNISTNSSGSTAQAVYSSGGTVTIAPIGSTVNISAQGATGGYAVNASNGATVTLGAAGKTVDITGDVLAKTGAGVAVSGTANTITGNVSVSDATSSATLNNTTVSGDIDVNNGTLTLHGTNAIHASGSEALYVHNGGKVVNTAADSLSIKVTNSSATTKAIVLDNTGIDDVNLFGVSDIISTGGDQAYAIYVNKGSKATIRGNGQSTLAAYATDGRAHTLYVSYDNEANNDITIEGFKEIIGDSTNSHTRTVNLYGGNMTINGVEKISAYGGKADIDPESSDEAGLAYAVTANPYADVNLDLNGNNAQIIATSKNSSAAGISTTGATAEMHVDGIAEITAQTNGQEGRYVYANGLDIYGGELYLNRETGTGANISVTAPNSYAWGALVYGDGKIEANINNVTANSVYAYGIQNDGGRMDVNLTGDVEVNGKADGNAVVARGGTTTITGTGTNAIAAHTTTGDAVGVYADGGVTNLNSIGTISAASDGANAYAVYATAAGTTVNISGQSADSKTALIGKVIAEDGGALNLKNVAITGDVAETKDSTDNYGNIKFLGTNTVDGAVTLNHGQSVTAAADSYSLTQVGTDATDTITVNGNVSVSGAGSYIDIAGTSTAKAAITGTATAAAGSTLNLSNATVGNTLTNNGTATLNNVSVAKFANSAGSVTTVDGNTNLSALPAQGEGITNNGVIYGSDGVIRFVSDTAGTNTDFRNSAAGKLYGGTAANPEKLDTLYVDRYLEYGQTEVGTVHITGQPTGYFQALSVVGENASLNAENIIVDTVGTVAQNVQINTNTGGSITAKNITGNRFSNAAGTGNQHGTTTILDGGLVKVNAWQNQSIDENSFYAPNATVDVAWRFWNDADSTIGTLKLGGTASNFYDTDQGDAHGDLKVTNLIMGDGSDLHLYNDSKLTVGNLSTEEDATSVIVVSDASDNIINKDGNGTVNFTGDIKFDSNEGWIVRAGYPQYSKGRGTSENAKFAMNLTNADSSFTGAIYETYDEARIASTDHIKGMTLNVSNGATWNVTGDSFVNNLTVDGGKLLGNKAVTIGNNGTVNTTTAVETMLYVAPEAELTTTDLTQNVTVDAPANNVSAIKLGSDSTATFNGDTAISFTATNASDFKPIALRSDGGTATFNGANTVINARNEGYSTQLSSDANAVYNFNSTEKTELNVTGDFGVQGLSDRDGGTQYNFGSKVVNIKGTVDEGVGSANDIGMSLWQSDVNVASTVDSFNIDLYGVGSNGADGVGGIQAWGESTVDIDAKAFNINIENGKDNTARGITFNTAKAEALANAGKYSEAYGLFAVKDDYLSSGNTVNIGASTDTNITVKDHYAKGSDVYGIFAHESTANVLGNTTIDTAAAGTNAKAYSVYAQSNSAVTLGSTGKTVALTGDVTAKEGSSITVNGTGNTITGKFDVADATSSATLSNTTISENVTNAGTLTVKDTVTASKTFTNSGKLNLSDANHTVGTTLNVGSFTGVAGGSIDFDADISGSKQDTDHITVTTKADGTIALGHVNIKADDPTTTGKTLALFRDTTGTPSETIFKDLTITGNATTQTSTGNIYSFVQDTSADDKKGNLVGTYIEGSYTLPEIVQNRKNPEISTEYEPGNITTYSLTSDYTTPEALGTLTNVSDQTTRELAIYGNGNNLSGGGYAGITVNSNGTLILKDINSVSGFSGGVVNSSGTLTVDNTTFSENTATDRQGVITVAGGSADIKDSKFLNNSAATDGGAMWINNSAATVDIANTEFTGNKITGNDVGGAITLRTGTVTLNNSTFKDNAADNGWGGAIFTYSLPNEATLNINGGSFTNNSARADGALAAMTVTNIDGTTFTGNKATASDDDGGGAIFMGSVANVSIANAIFDGNMSNARGGAISTRYTGDDGSSTNVDAKLDIIGTTFKDNTAATTGGALDNYFFNSKTAEGYTYVGGSTFTNNSANKGGAIYNREKDSSNNPVKLKVENTDFTGNTATGTGSNGGAIYNEGTLAFGGTTNFSGNTANGVANDIYNTGTLEFANGSVTNFAGGIVSTKDVTVGTGATVNFVGAANVADNFINYGTMNAAVSGFSGNLTSSGNGAVITLSDVVTGGNYATASGGKIVMESGTVSTTNDEGALAAKISGDAKGFVLNGSSVLDSYSNQLFTTGLTTFSPATPGASTEAERSAYVNENQNSGNVKATQIDFRNGNVQVNDAHYTLGYASTAKGALSNASSLSAGNGKTNLIMTGDLVTADGINTAIVEELDSEALKGVALDKVTGRAINGSLLVGKTGISEEQHQALETSTGIDIKDMSLNSVNVDKLQLAQQATGVIITNRESVTLGGASGRGENSSDIIKIETKEVADVDVVVGLDAATATTLGVKQEGTLNVGNAGATDDSKYLLSGDVTVNDTSGEASNKSEINIEGQAEIAGNLTLSGANVTIGSYNTGSTLSIGGTTTVNQAASGAKTTIAGTIQGDTLVNNGTVVADAGDLQYRTIENNSIHTLELGDGAIAADITTTESDGRGSVVVNGAVTATGKTITNQDVTVNATKALTLTNGISDNTSYANAGTLNLMGSNLVTGSVSGEGNTNVGGFAYVDGTVTTETNVKGGLVSQDKTAVGYNNRFAGSTTGSVAIGNNNNISGNNTFVLGNNVTTAASNSVALGNGSTIGGNNEVSVGSSSQTRKITNVTAGTLSNTSTDAVNGSQLYDRTTMAEAGKYYGKGERITAAIGNVDTQVKLNETAIDGIHKSEAMTSGITKDKVDNYDTYVTSTGLNANDKAISNVSAQVIENGGTNAATTGQVFAEQEARKAASVKQGAVTGTNNNELTLKNADGTELATVDMSALKTTQGNTLEGYFTDGAANKAIADGAGNNISATYATKAEVTSSTEYVKATKYNSTGAVPVVAASGTDAGGATALGYNSRATGNYSTAVGYGANASGYIAVALGYGARANGSSSIAIGKNANATTGHAIGIGDNATAGDGAVAIGHDAKAAGNNAVALGYSGNAAAANSFAFGGTVASTATKGVAIGQGSSVTGTATNSVALGANSVASAANEVSVGKAGEGGFTRSITNVTSAGTLSGTNTNASTGADIYKETRKDIAASGTNYIAQGNTAGTNLAALDTAMGKVAAGNYVNASDGTAANSLAKNIQLLDTALGAKPSGTLSYITADGTVNANLTALDTAMAGGIDFMAGTNGNQSVAIGKKANFTGATTASTGVTNITTAVTGTDGNASIAIGLADNVSIKNLTATGEVKGATLNATSSVAVGTGTTITDGNITVGTDYSFDTTNGLKVGSGTTLNNSQLTIGTSTLTTDTLTVGGTTVNASGIVANGGNVKFTTNGISAGSQQIANVASGIDGTNTFASTNKNAANIGDVYNAATVKVGSTANINKGNGIEIVAGANIELTPEDGKVTIKSLGGTDAEAVHYDDASTKDMVTFGGTGATTPVALKNVASAGELSGTNSNASTGADVYNATTVTTASVQSGRYAANSAVTAAVTALDTAIGDMSGFGTNNYAKETNDVAKNIKALDTQVSGNASNISTLQTKAETYDKYVTATGLNGNGSKITNVAAGDLGSTSTDVVIGKQLNATNVNVATNAAILQTLQMQSGRLQPAATSAQAQQSVPTSTHLTRRLVQKSRQRVTTSMPQA